MRFKLTLLPTGSKTTVPFNYQYALAAVIFKKVAAADEQYANFLHQQGYALNNYSKHFKFFTFSNLEGRFTPQQNALLLQGNQTGFVLCCHMPEFAAHLITGVFTDQLISIGGSGAVGRFRVEQIVSLPAAFKDDDEIHTMQFKPLSPLVVGRTNAKGNDDYLSPEDEDFIPLLHINLADKLAVAYNDSYSGRIGIKVKHEPGKLKSRLVTIKEGTAAETKVRGFFGFALEMTAPGRVINFVLDVGLGGMNSMGFGCVEVK
ncbi:CRISPR-associated endoribonuclease Cas6 [Mucilaginibacter paludis]|uniref:CRISPR-associated endoribonuclease n=1 Tax=Mucilaginibacter paludis DSM 18603 TaxID=714943 RepID=H1YB50_9SPHI|nr:CRISPR-associated endoribonuclease Cas6 [Mucilaginibacter paludis]EHQ30576.1 CRISPR-associated protein Cas6 [Mucilaginibacter paludis DSM 18603]